jgi:hypothetical protein
MQQQRGSESGWTAAANGDVEFGMQRLAASVWRNPDHRSSRQREVIPWVGAFMDIVRAVPQVEVTGRFGSARHGCKFPLCIFETPPGFRPGTIAIPRRAGHLDWRAAPHRDAISERD